MSETLAFTGARIFDGDHWHADSALVADSGRVAAITRDVPAGAIRLDGGMIVPGFVDLQVNGGGGALFNGTPTLQAIETICAAHARFGTTALLATLITDTAEVTDAAIEAGISARKAGVPGFLGLHLEGPHLSVARKGAHDPALIRPPTDADLQRIFRAREGVGPLVVTVAAETVSPDQIALIVQSGTIVSIGHSDASFAVVEAAADAGATMVTHLFNAMSQLGNREPGLVGAALADGRLHAGLIADGIHVHPASIGVALRAKRGPGAVFLVSDAMSLTGSDATSFSLNGRTIYRKDGALRLADGTLAGADLTMIGAVRYMHETLGLPLDNALRLATINPAIAMRVADTHGHLRPGARADFLHLSNDLEVQATWIGGRQVFAR